MDTKKATLRQLIIASLGAEGRTRTGTYFYGRSLAWQAPVML